MSDMIPGVPGGAISAAIADMQQQGRFYTDYDRDDMAQRQGRTAKRHDDIEGQARVTIKIFTVVGAAMWGVAVMKAAFVPTLIGGTLGYASAEFLRLGTSVPYHLERMKRARGENPTELTKKEFYESHKTMGRLHALSVGVTSPVRWLGGSFFTRTMIPGRGQREEFAVLHPWIANTFNPEKWIGKSVKPEKASKADKASAIKDLTKARRAEPKVERQKPVKPKRGLWGRKKPAPALGGDGGHPEF